MVWFIGKTLIAALVISFSSWFAGKRPALAGFLLALPLTTMLALAFNYTEYTDPEKSVAFARSIFVGVPLSLLFFVPFLFGSFLRLPFWGLYAFGGVLLACGYFVHSALLK